MIRNLKAKAGDVKISGVVNDFEGEAVNENGK